MASVLAPPLAGALNHLLAGASWARERLKPFAGKTVRFNLAPLTVSFAIRATGDVEDAPADGNADAAFTLTPGIALRVLGADRDAWREIEAAGDTELGREILYIAQNLRWDVEEDLSRIVGDIAAHRMVQAAGELERWGRETAGSFARSAAAYWTEEQPLIARRADVEHFNREVDRLRDDVERLAKRMEHLGRGRS